MTPQVIPIDRSLFPQVSRPGLAEVSKAQIMLTGGSRRVPFTDLGLVPLPEITHRDSTGNVSYQPLGYTEYFGAVIDIYSALVDAEPVCADFVLARSKGVDGGQAYGAIMWPEGEAVIVRSSYDGSISNQLATGSGTACCANGQFIGTNMVRAKHTMNVGGTVLAMILSQAEQATRIAREMAERLARWSDTPVTDDLMFAMIGVLTHRGLITSTMGNIAARYWKACHSGELHDSHGKNDLSSAYQALTGGLHCASPRNVMHGYNAVTEVVEHISHGVLPGQGEGIPAIHFEIPEFIEA